MLVGAGGSGKSTCALSCLTSDLLYAGDDYVGVQLEPEPRVLSLFCSGKLEPDHAELLPHLPSPSFAGDGALEEKSVFYVAERFPERMCRGFPLRAIVAPRVQGAEPQVTERGPAQVLAALAPSTLLQLVPARQEALSAMAGLLRGHSGIRPRRRRSDRADPARDRAPAQRASFMTEANDIPSSA